MSTPPELHRDDFERTDALPRLDLNVLADATPINSDLLTRTDTWSFELLRDLRWPLQSEFDASRPVVPRVDTSKLQVVEDNFVEMIAPIDLGFTEPEVAPPASEESATDSRAAQQIAATLEQEIVLFAEEHVAGSAVGAVEPQLDKANAVQHLRDLAILLDTEIPSHMAPPAQPHLSGASIEAVADEGITWVDMPPQDYTPTLAGGAQQLQQLLDAGQTDSSAMARDLALKLMDGTAARDVATFELDPQSLVHALFPKSHHQQQAEMLSAHQTIEELRASNELLQQAIATAQERVEFLKSEVERHTEIAQARDSQLATSIEELTSRRLAMRELERAVQGRDEIISSLRAELDAVKIELQTARDERGIMALNLNKTRERAKLLRQQLLEKNLTLQNLHADPAERTQTIARPTDGSEILPDRLLMPIDHGGPSIALDRPLMTIGRTGQTDICIPSTLISRQHARLTITTDAVVIEDLNSTNGCFVNDRRVQKKMVREGDVLTLADMKYRLNVRNPRGMLTD